MGMHLHTYLIVGYKTTQQDAKTEWGDLYEELLDENIEGITMIYGEGSDTAVIGEVLARTDEYSSQDPVLIESQGRSSLVLQALRRAGIQRTVEEIKPYLFGVWL